MKSLEQTIKWLLDRESEHLAALLVFSTFKLEKTPPFSRVSAVIYSPEPFNECLQWESRYNEDMLLEALIETSMPADWEGEFPSAIRFEPIYVPYPEEFRLYPQLVLLRKELVASSYNLQRLQKHDRSYQSRYVWVDAALKARGWDNPIVFETLLAWDDYATKNLKTAPFRNQYLDSIFEPLLKRLLSLPTPALAHPREPTGWDRVDRALSTLHRSLSTARHEEDFQAIGLTCREVLISVGQAVYDYDAHGAVDGIVPSKTDGARMIEAFLRHVASGTSNAHIRKHAKAAMELAVELQHKRTADFQAAALCLEATVSVTNIVSILAGRRQPS